MKFGGYIELTQTLFVKNTFDGFDAHGVEQIGRTFDTVDFVESKLVPTRFVPVEFVIDRMVRKPQSLHFRLPIGSR